MAEVSARQVVVIAAVAGALVGGVVAGGVAAAASGNDNSTASPSGDGSQVATAAVVRTNLTSTVQVGGSIGYDGYHGREPVHGLGGVYLGCRSRGAVIRGRTSRSLLGRRRAGAAAVRRFRRTGSSPSGCPTAPTWLTLVLTSRPAVALGYGDGLTQGNHYSPATATAVSSAGHEGRSACRKPARSRSARRSSSPGPSASRRRVRRAVGTPAGGGIVLTATSATPAVVSW